jgi:hypothetical protein
MSRLTQNTTPAERIRGCTFSETFETAQSVVHNGGTIAGTPSIDFGAVFNGTTDYMTYSLRGDEFNSAEISIVLMFYPDFDTDEDVTRRLFDASSGSAYQVVKSNNASSNTLTIALGGTSIAAVAEGTYSPYWDIGERNVLVISGTTGDTSAWLNGNLILDKDSSAWSAAVPANFYIGSAFNGTQLFDGKIAKLQVFQSVLTAKEALDFYNTTTYSYINDAVLDLPMDAARHDPVNVRTLDVSGNSNHATFGNGITTSTYPTKLQKRGYDFDGGDYLVVDGAGIYNSTETSIAFAFSPDYDVSDDVTFRCFDSTSGSAYQVIKNNNAASNSLSIVLGGTLIANIPEATYGSYWQKGTTNVLIISGTSGDTSAWLNGRLILDKDSSAWTPKDPASIYIGSSFAPSQFFDGRLLQFQVYNFILTPLQASDLNLKMMKQVNHV